LSCLRRYFQRFYFPLGVAADENISPGSSSQGIFSYVYERSPSKSVDRTFYPAAFSLHIQQNLMLFLLFLMSWKLLFTFWMFFPDTKKVVFA
jgi:hypothetical protein